MVPRIHTALTDALDVDVPIISAPMAMASTPELAASVSKAGGLGLMGAAITPSADLVKSIRTVRSLLNIEEGKPVPFGFGFMGWLLDKTETSPDPRLPPVLDELPTVIWLALGDDLGKYVRYVRDYDAKREHKTKIFVMVGTVEEALRVAESKPDFIVAQGTEAGGHGSSIAPPMLSILQAVLDALPNGPPVIATGGISSGAQIAGLLTMGAAGVTVGTRFLFTHECCYNTAQKEALVRADLNATIKSFAFDEVTKIVGWPDKCDGRAIYNKVIDDAHEGLDLDERIKRYTESTKAGDVSRLIVWAGVGAGMTTEIKSTSDVMMELYTDMVKTLEKAQGLLGTKL